MQSRFGKCVSLPDVLILLDLINCLYRWYDNLSINTEVSAQTFSSFHCSRLTSSDLWFLNVTYINHTDFMSRQCLLSVT